MGKDRSHNRIDEELVCVDSLAHCLKHQCGCNKVTADREPDDPPDFWVTIDGERFAVEVTSIVIAEAQAYRANCRSLEQAIRTSSQNRGCLAGQYVLLIRRRPGFPKSTSHEWRALVARATSFIEATRDAESVDEARLLDDANGSVGIAKVSGRGATVGRTDPVELRWEGEFQDELRQLMEDRVTEKRRKLERKGVPIRCPRIMLLLYDAFGYADGEDAQGALLAVDGYDWFHSVFWAASFTDRLNDLSPANPGRIGRFLYSANGNWWTSPTTQSR